jgi:hypothetical protein
LFLKAEPQMIGKKAEVRTGADAASSASSIGFLAFEEVVHRLVVHFDGSFDQFGAVLLGFFSMSAGISTTSNFAPRDSSFQMIAFMLTRSITPSKSLSAPIGSWINRVRAETVDHRCPRSR